ncbi:MAG: translation initiation factor IF-2 [Planctomycetota bacterium]
MAKKPPTKRVFQLAKELGVSSKDVVTKCQAEDVPGITNHMSTVSLGLAETIRDWFGGAGHGTAVQTAAPVDVKKARARASKKATRKKATPVGDMTAVATEAEAIGATAISEPVVEEPPLVEAEATHVVPEPVVIAEPEPVAPEAPAEIEAPAVAAEAPAEVVSPAATDTETDDGAGTEVDAGPGGTAPTTPGEAGSEVPPQMNVPSRPDVITPVGPKLEKPTRVKLAGPRVIRVESPEVIHRPPPRPRTGGQGGMRPPRPGGGGAGAGAGVMPSEGPGGRGGAGAGAGAGGRGGASRRNKRRSATARDDNARTGRLSPAGQGQRPFNWREQDLLERERRLSRSGGFFRAARRDNLKRTSGGGHRAATAAQSGGTVKVSEPITIKDLSAATGVKSNDILKRLLLAGQPATVNGTISADDAVEIMQDYSIELEVVTQQTAEEKIAEQFAERDYVDEQPRSPVVAILGHVDHGKTSLLDRIRKANVADGEAGGITQATSAFQVPVTVGDVDRKVTFIDTPGHEAFTEMRSRGAQVTDIVVLVVAADDGVMPQTIESINHAKAAGVPIVVALNKIDKAEATDTNIQRILGQLAEHELNPVEWGGSTEVVRTSAIQDEGIQDLLEILDFQAQLLELTADFGGNAEGSVIEAELQEGRGAVASVLLQQGHLKKGDFIVVGRAFGRVRDIVNDHGERITEAAPSMPIAISGLNEVPDAGDKFYVCGTLKEAEAAADERKVIERERDLTQVKVTLDNIFEKLAEAGRKELPLIVKADVGGSVETLRATLEKISTPAVTISVKHAAVGGVNDSDILLSEAAGAIILGFNVTASGKARKLAEAKGVDIRLYDVIYDITDDVTKAAEGLLEPEYKLEVLGHADVRAVFKVSKTGMVAGCYVTDGVIERNAQIRVTRDGIVVEKDRRLDQLRHFKEDVKEIRSGQECGMRIEGYDDIKEGDVLECYKTLEVRRSLESTRTPPTS